jgi:hypothetical protein
MGSPPGDWYEPGTIIRDFPLKPGLNVVWSPDPGTGRAGPIGHGGGETMLCRFLRYCLGEDSFAPDGQRQRIWDKLPNGRVGAEVMLDGELWAVVRSLAVRKPDVVVRNGTLEDASREDAAATGIEPLRDAITAAILREVVKLFPASINQSTAWEAALAWMTRDQECRFGSHLEWRDANSDSRSPIRGRSIDDRLAVVRALIGALTTAEITAQASEQEESCAEKRLSVELGHLDWLIGRSRAGLFRTLEVPSESAISQESEAAHFKEIAAARYAEALNQPTGTTGVDLEGVRQARDEAAEELRKLELELSDVSARIEEKNRTVAFQSGHLPEAKARLTKERTLVCPLCAVLIDKALTEGCKFSSTPCDLKALEREIQELRDGVERETREIEALQNRQPTLKYGVSAAEQKLGKLKQSVLALERSLLDHSNAQRITRRLLDDAERYEELVASRARIASEADKAEAALASRRKELVEHRASAKDTIRRLSTKFDSVLRELVPGEIRGEAKLDGNGLSLTVKLGGERSTAAIESLKVVAFDLAVLALTLEGHTSLPGFLVHDSPREADLGQSIYDRLFAFAKTLEGFGPCPLFQYIITTTTEPPGEFRSEPWLRLTLHGAPAEKRLLGIDL